MSFDVLSPLEPLPIPPRRLALVRANVLDAIERLERAAPPARRGAAWGRHGDAR